MEDPKTKAFLTYKQLKESVNAFAAILKTRGLNPGDVLCILAPNCIQYPVAMFGAIRAGLAVTTVNPTYLEHEVLFQLQDSKSKCIVYWPAFEGLARAAGASAGIDPSMYFEFNDFGTINGSNIGHTIQQLVEEGKNLVPGLKFEEPSTPSITTAYLCYSSGTTGRSKGVETTHDNMVFNVHQLEPMETISESDSVLAMLPFFHIYANMIILHYCLWKRTTIYVMTKFDFIDYLTFIQDLKITTSHIVPPVALALSKHPVVDKYNLKSLKRLVSGAAPLGQEITSALSARIGVRIRQAYGMTETTPLVTYTPENDFCEGSSGILAPGIEAKIVDAEGNELGIDEPGELLLKGRNIMKGYLGNLDATNETLVNGWLRTGDVVKVNKDGHYFIVDRIKELIKYKGFQVPPAELEALLLTHPDIADAAVIGIPDEEAGELPKAFVVLKEKHSAAAEEIQEFVAGKVNRNKKLRGGVEFISAIPKSASGKILRRMLKQ
jgi:acyl-CoA synthetase (AMP-forming)/AMP-acid ligase II